MHELRAETHARHTTMCATWDKQLHGTSPPQPFTDAWYEHPFCQPLVNWYHEVEPIVLDRQHEALRQKALQAAQSTDDQMEADPPTESDNTAHVVMDEELDEEAEPHVPVTEEETRHLLNEFNFGEPLAASTPYPVDFAAQKANPAHPAESLPLPLPSRRNPSPQPKTPLRSRSPPSRTVRSIKRRDEEASSSSSRMNSSSSKGSREPSRSGRSPPKKDARRDRRRESRSPSPNLKRHLDRAAAFKDRKYIPVLDGYVSKDLTVHVALNGHQQHNWVQEFLDVEKPYELLGLINRIGVPASYLRVDHFRPTNAGNRTPLANIVIDQMRTENTILPWNFILTNTLGALPPYWRQCRSTTRNHLTKSLKDSSRYRDFSISGIGPVGFDLRGCRANDSKEYEEQRLNMIDFAKLASDTNQPLTVIIAYDEVPNFTHNVHADAIRALREENIPSRQRIHLLFGRATAIELLRWLEAFPRTLLSFDLYYLGGIRSRLARQDPSNDKFRAAQAIQDFLKFMPLENIALHS